MRRAFAWIPIAALVVLAARAVVYALSPSPLARELSHQAGGPQLPVLTAASLTLALAVSAATVWLAALGVRERRLLETRRVLAAPRLRLGVLATRALALWLVSMPAFAYLESYIHWRQGLGWHGLHCLTGPVHRNAIPVLGGFSLVAAALATAVEHVLAWMRRTIARLIASPRSPGVACVTTPPPYSPALTPAFAAALGARAPPPIS
jgi:hypothetical protein